MTAPPPPRPDVVLDARWWNVGGTGSFTRSLVRGLGELSLDQRWLVWGPSAAGPHLWPGAVHLPTEIGPAAWFGQRQAWRVPAADVVLHPHQTRPAHRRAAASCVLDLIQLQHPDRLARVALRRRLAATEASADVLFTIAPSVRQQLVAEFGVDPAAIRVLHLPVDRAAAARIRARRQAWRQAGERPARILLAVGRFAPHKNHDRLIRAFSATRFAATGGELHLIGGTAEELGRTTATLPRGVRVRGRLDDHLLLDAMTDALALVQPSLVEGFGLPVAEALAAGLPVTSSPIPAVTEFGPTGIPVFDPRSIPGIAAAIDETVELIEGDRYWSQVDRAGWLGRQPHDRDLARAVHDGLAPLLGSAPCRPSPVVGTRPGTPEPSLPIHAEVRR